MKVIALLPIRNEAWVLSHTLSVLSGFCDVILVNDQKSDDGSRDICRRYPKVVLFESVEPRICEEARWELFDRARDYEGTNLLWCTDADELVSPGLVTRFLGRAERQLTAGTVVECLWYQLWKSLSVYRDDQSVYRPHWKGMAFVDDRRSDYDRFGRLPLHRPRVPVEGVGPTLQAEGVPIMHLQWVAWEHNQMKQAWYRCREWLNGEKSAAEINNQYSITLDVRGARTVPVPLEWTEGVTFPEVSREREPSWHQLEIVAWFEEFGVEMFEPLEMWHLAALRKEFQQRTGRRPRPDRSYMPGWPERVRRSGGRVLRAARRRMGL